MLRWLLALALGVGTPSVACVASAETAREDEPRAAPSVPSAPQQHFLQALVHYRAGRYREAIVSLRRALELDPESKDLVFNLARVHEKLGELDAAIQWLERYIELEADPAEVESAQDAIIRMRGAKVESAPPAAKAHALPSPPSIERPIPTSVARSGVDAWVLAGTGLTAAAAVVGIVFGMRALVLQPGSQADGASNAGLERRRHRARESAVVADIALSVSLLSGASTALLWLGRGSDCPKDDVPVGFSFSGAF